jgi:hypothetical protein
MDRFLEKLEHDRRLARRKHDDVEAVDEAGL